jgi:hypothetical protein
MPACSNHVLRIAVAELMGTWYRVNGWHFHKKQELCNKRHEQMTQASITNFRSKLTWLSSHSVEFKLMQNNHRGNCIVKFQNVKIQLPFNYKCEEKLPGFAEIGWKFTSCTGRKNNSHIRCCFYLPNTTSPSSVCPSYRLETQSWITFSKPREW